MQKKRKKWEKNASKRETKMQSNCVHFGQFMRGVRIQFVFYVCVSEFECGFVACLWNNQISIQLVYWIRILHDRRRAQCVCIATTKRIEWRVNGKMYTKTAALGEYSRNYRGGEEIQFRVRLWYKWLNSTRKYFNVLKQIHFFALCCRCFVVVVFNF